MAKYNANFHNKFYKVISLLGNESFTDVAILSLLENQHFPILDGNIKRVLTRYYGIEG
ncbi:MAG: hypothetical protein ACEY3J_02235 [Arsenophonus sp.]